MNTRHKPKYSLASLADGILQGNRVVLGQAITLVESTRAEDQALAAQLLANLYPHTGKATRLGITGVPGVGKSTFIEALGMHLVNAGKKVAVLTIDPSSPLTRGSILGDKTRMETLARHSSSFVRPSASGNALGGVTHKTREAMLLCEAAGFDVIIIETVGVGQSEVAVKNMVDFFLLLMLAGAGDELQGIKKGIMEMADAVVITKADGDNIKRAREASADYQHAFHLLAPSRSGWTPRVLISSAMTGEGIDAVWKMVEHHRDTLTLSGYLATNRAEQNAAWFNDYFDFLLRGELQALKHLRTQLEANVTQGTITSPEAATQLLQAYHRIIREQKG